MLLILSGEGPTDLGSCSGQMGGCSIPDFKIGPLTKFVDQMVERVYGYSPLEVTPDVYRYYGKAALVERNNKRIKAGKIFLPGKKHAIETGYFYTNSWMLGEIAKELESLEGDVSASVFFRDTDPTASASRRVWGEKHQSIVSGFERAGYRSGVPMLALPKSEAWLLCAIKDNPYQNCADLERLSGNDDSPNSAKSQLEAFLGERGSREKILEWMEQNPFDHDEVSRQMGSYSAFKERMTEVLEGLNN
ncbi:hypothetical protein F471_04505 [Pseudomonas sp. URMO17WK12:I1]|uniref:hypothetical protein n=1 Tax=unclassified Pseudomonas TaxID=196821 RepID=UPI000DB232E9|nr:MULTISPECIES: hypothetical protein [unclassified Pseudomonas]PZW62873.1 hypothetical protein F471_04505 [Pseudomonas sp. URMO17WK12:I1]